MWKSSMDCRVGCGACCIALSISSAIPGTLAPHASAGVPHGKPAGVRCIQLSDDNRCQLYGMPERPDVCARLKPSLEMCGETTQDAMAYLGALEELTRPD